MNGGGRTAAQGKQESICYTLLEYYAINLPTNLPNILTTMSPQYYQSSTNPFDSCETQESTNHSTQASFISWPFFHQESRQ